MRTHSKLTGLALLASGALALTGCASDGGAAGASDDTLSIGISQIVQHPALDATREGFKQAFADAGYVEGEDVSFDEQNAQGEQATATTIAAKFQTDGVDLVLAIATPTAQAAAQSIADIPVLFTAVTEPAEAGLVDSWEKPGGNVTGTSDLNPVEQQLELVTKVVPDAKTVGIVYSSGEVNSEVQVELAKEAADELGLTIKEATVTNSSEVAQATESLGDVDAIYIPTDNRVTEGLEAVVQIAEQKQIPLFGAEGGQVERGAIATYGIDYTELGYQTGKMAIEILENGADPAEMPVETLDELSLIVNPAAAERQGVTLPEDLVADADQTIE
ncbi:ABC transporter substrate-binding protein [Agromyces lapidis]|uniref:ABC transporter substrate-binding protein n=1 Tax=Agromyces lapidis TaxID=279574 RepID=A0ABV5STE5_9MICO|nr:ABC transporter substrate-binding protein [Agromyces lapidis]